MQMKQSRIPLLEQLKQIISEEKISSPNRMHPHVWGKPQIDFSTFSFLREGESPLKAVCRVTICRVCQVCGSKRMETAYLIKGDVNGDLHWELFRNAGYRYVLSEKYFLSECYRRSYYHQCPICGKFYQLKKEAEECRELHLQEKKEAEKLQIKRNLEIIGKLMGSRSRLAQKRIRIAAYRLYRYLNMSPDAIASAIGVRNTRVQSWIGQTFKELCLKDQECIFKPLFKGNADFSNEKAEES